MYALYAKPEALMNVTWPCGNSAEDATRSLALKSDLPLEWSVTVSRSSGSISVTVTNAKGYTVHVHEGKSVDFYADGRDGYYDAPTGHDMVTVHEDRRVGTIYDTGFLDDLRDLADRVHMVEVHLDHVIVDGVLYSGCILMDEDGALSDLPYDDPEVYAMAMGLRLEVMPMSE